ncbi:MAG: DUF4738 domain-containing protein [Prevotella sp.]|nr:DUF4738 domain-containing protein [Candidatus Prevotella equi]
MKKFLSIAIILTAAVLFSCKSEKNPDEIIIETIDELPDEGPQHMGKESNSGTVKWIGGAAYHYEITRQSVDSLGTIENNGKTYYHNSVTLEVKRSDGTTFFKKTFTKANFAPAVPQSFNETGVLLGMNLEKAEGNTLRFVVNIGSPDIGNEEFVYVLMTLDNFGATKAEPYKGNMN